MGINWNEYQAAGLIDEMIDENGKPRSVAKALARYLETL